MLAPASEPPAHEPNAAPMGPLRLIGLARARWKAVTVIVALTTLAVFAWNHFVLAREPVFSAATVLDITPSQAQVDYGNAFARGSALQGAALLTRTYAEYARSRPVIEAIANDYIAEHPEALEVKRGLGIRKTIRMLDEGGPAVRDPRQLFVENLGKAIDVGTVEGTHLLRIAVKWDDPVAAADFANQLSARLIEESARRATAPTDDLHSTLAARLSEARAQLNQRQIEAAQTRASLGVADIQRQKQTLIDERIAEEARLTNERAQIAASATQVGALQRQSEGPLSSATPAIDQALLLEKPRLAGLQQSVRQRAARVGQLAGQLSRLSQAETRLGILDREIEALQTEVAALTERTNNVALDTLAGAPPIRIVEAATPPLARDSPRVLTNSFFGFVAGCVLAALYLLAMPRPVARAASEAAPPAHNPFDGRSYQGLLIPPTARRSFTADESREIRRRLDAWLAEPLASAGGTLYVLAADEDGDAVAVYNLIAAFLKARGEAVNAETDYADGDTLVRTRSRGLVYCGGLSQSGQVPPHTADDETLILVARRRSGAEALDSLHATLEAAGWPEPYLIQLDR